MGATGDASFLGIGLRGTGTLSISSDRLVSAGVTYLVADIAWAGLVNDPEAPAGAQPLPALAWRMTNDLYASATPAHPEEAWKVLEELFKFRPDLRTPLPSPPLSSYGYTLANSSRGANTLDEPVQQDHNQTVMAGLAHLSFFFGGLIVPYILWKVNRKRSPYAAEQSKQAFYFHGVIGIALTILASIAFNQATPDDGSAFSAVRFVLWYVLLFAVYIFGMVFSIIGAVKAFGGQPFHYPLISDT